MTVDKALYQAPKGLDSDEKPELEVEIESDDDEGTTIEAGEDGSVVVNLGPEEKTYEPDGHDENLAEKLDENYLRSLASDLIADVDEDERSRDEWEETLKSGMKLLGLKIESRSEPWEGACGIQHPLLTEAVVRFQSELITETFPAVGPVKTKILGIETDEKLEAAERVRDDLNIELTDRMTEYRHEHERMLWNLPIMGSAFKKIYYDPNLGRQTAMFVSAEDFIVAYGASDLQSCPRYTHRMKRTKNDVARLQERGFYHKVELQEPTNRSSTIQDEKEKLSGQTSLTETNYHTLYEINVEVNLKGVDKEDELPKPYVITIDYDSQQVLAIRRNWRKDDANFRKRQYFVHYQYIPGFGFYGFGLIHLVGGFAEGATSLLRQLVDAGTLSNLPGGLKTRGLRIKGDDNPIAPGEWRDVDVPGGTLKENLLPLPYKEPSVVLAGLLDKIVEEGRKFAAIAEMKLQDFDTNSPVGTTMALLERTLKVMSAIQARIYDEMKREFRLIKELISEFGEDEYQYEPATGTREMKRDDFSMVDVMPVADPNAATMSQRIVQWQAVMQLAAMAPQIYDLPELHGQMLDILGVKNVDKLIPARRAKNQPTDPVTENMNILTMQPVKAFLTQDHNAHIAVHQSMMQDPMIQQMVNQNPQAQAIQAAMMAHIMEHVGFAYRQQIEQQFGAPLPHPEDDLPPQVETRLAGLLAQASQKLLTQNQNAANMAKQQQAAQDPVFQQQQMELQIKQAEVQRKMKKDEADIEIEKAKLALEAQKVASETGASEIDLQMKEAEGRMKLELESQKHAMKMQQEQEKAAMQMQTERMKSEATMQTEAQRLQFDQAKMGQEMQMEQQRQQMQMQQQERQAQLQERQKDRQFSQGLSQKDAEHQTKLRQSEEAHKTTLEQQKQAAKVAGATKPAAAKKPAAKKPKGK